MCKLLLDVSVAATIINRLTLLWINLYDEDWARNIPYYFIILLTPVLFHDDIDFYSRFVNTEPFIVTESITTCLKAIE